VAAYLRTRGSVGKIVKEAFFLQMRNINIHNKETDEPYC
jgi:hypothetical protein